MVTRSSSSPMKNADAVCRSSASAGEPGEWRPRTRGPGRRPAAPPGAGTALLEATREQGLEGVVAKRLDCRYEPGRRSGAWLKIKNTLRQELVIGGWLPGEGRRTKRIGALLMGYFEEGQFVYAGR